MLGRSARSLVLSDPALAAIHGGFASADFGVENNLGLAMGSVHEAANLASHGQYGGAEQLDMDAHALVRDNRQLVAEQRLAHHLMLQRSHTEERLALLNPNGLSTEKIERYTFSVQQAVVLAAPEGLQMTNNPLTDIKPDRLIFNVPCYNFAFFSTVQVGNTSIIIGGQEDAYNYTNVAVAVTLGMPLCRTSSRIQVTGQYNGLSPSPFTPGNEYIIIGTFHGWARMTA